MLTFNDLKTTTGMYVRDIINALKHEGFPLPTMESGRELWWPEEVQAWMARRSTKGLPRWVSR
jgi:predicted DNA-binding transcriptional regulator AlpA